MTDHVSVSGSAYSKGLCRTGLLSKLSNKVWGVKFFLLNGKPNRVFRFGGGLGDHLMVTSVFREYRKRGEEGLWIMTDHPTIFEQNTDISRVVGDNWRISKYCTYLGSTPTTLSYGNWIGCQDKIEQPRSHILKEIMVRAGLTGEVDLRPWFPSVKDRSNKKLSSRICIQGAGTLSSTMMLNKQWIASRYMELAIELGKRYDLIQLGMPGESNIPSAQDLRGKLSIRETAEALSGSRFFIGQVGFLMHLARAVGTRSVIIYGGREKAWQSGYPCNENLETDPLCSPCWQSNHCDHNRVCLEDVQVGDVLDAVERIEGRLREPLETDTQIID